MWTPDVGLLWGHEGQREESCPGMMSQLLREERGCRRWHRPRAGGDEAVRPALLTPEPCECPEGRRVG